jgi:hypothetical protein
MVGGFADDQGHQVASKLQTHPNGTDELADGETPALPIG